MSEEYDAFGRRKGEDPLAGLGGQSVDLPSSSPAPAPGTGAPPPYAPQPAPIAMPSRPPRRRRTGGIVASLVAVMLVVGVVGGVFALVGMTVAEDVSTGVIATESAPVEATEEPSPAQGLQPGSLIRRGELTKALQKIRAAEVGSIVSLRVDPEDVSAQVKTRDGYLRHVTVRDGELTKGVKSGPGFNHIETIAARRVDPAAPERLVRSAARRMKRSTNEVNYLVLMNLAKPTWGLFFKDGVHFQGDTRGKIIRRTN